MANLSIRTKLGLIVAISIGLFVALFAVFTLSRAMSERAYDRALAWSHHAILVLGMQVDAERYVLAVERSLGSTGDPSARQIRAAREALESARAQSFSMAKSFSEEERDEEAEVSVALLRLMKRGDEIAIGRNPVGVPGIREFYEEEVEPKLRLRAEEEQEGSRESAQHGRIVSARILARGTAATFFFLLVGAVLCMSVARTITKSLAYLENEANRIANGELLGTIALPSRDELGRLAASFNKMSHNLGETMVQRSALEATKAELETKVEQLSQARADLERQISGRKALEAGARRGEKLAAVGQLAAGVAHEINNPLGVILGFAQGMERRVPEGNPLRLPVTAIVREALRCKNLVQELLTFSRTAKKTTEELDLNAVVRSTVVLLEARAKTQGVEVVQELHEPLPALRANRTQLQQVIVNLGTNAMDAMSSGGKLTFRTRLNRGGKAVLDVADTGTGIPEELRSRIFEPFFTTKEVGKGTGLGLSLVHEIVEQHEGSIRIESQAGRGTLMSVELPAASAASGASAAGTARAAQGGLP